MENHIIPIDNIANRIYLIRNKRVMLDRDLAELYGVKPIRLREQVKRNLSRFPEDFMFQISEQEADAMVSQNAIPSRQHLGGYLPYVFTEHGTLMLANVLKSEKAIKMSVLIVRAFVKLREMLSTHEELRIKLEELESRQGKSEEYIQAIIGTINKMLREPEPSGSQIGFIREDNI